MLFGQDIGGTLWLIVDVVFVAVLAAALVYGLRQWNARKTSRRLDQARDSAVRRHYDEET